AAVGDDRDVGLVEVRDRVDWVGLEPGCDDHRQHGQADDDQPGSGSATTCYLRAFPHAEKITQTSHENSVRHGRCYASPTASIGIRLSLRSIRNHCQWGE